MRSGCGPRSFNNVLAIVRRNPPLRFVTVQHHFRPLSSTKLPRSNKHARSELQSRPSCYLPVIAVYGSQQRPHLHRNCDRRMVRGRTRRKRSYEDQFPGTPGRSCTFVESAIHDGVVRIGGREIDIRGSLEKTKSDLLDRIAEYLAGLYGRSMHDIRHVQFVADQLWEPRSS
jgi:hypothetical protein